jgi:pilus assembly protein CpaF
MQEIFHFDRHGIDPEGRVVGELVPTGLRPACSEQLKLAGFELPWQLFERQSAAGAR